MRKIIFVLFFALLVVFTLTYVLTITNDSAVQSVSTGVVTESYLTDKQHRQVSCLTEAIWYEARGEGWYGMMAVANVIYNRVKSDLYPSSFCSVIEQRKQFSYKLISRDKYKLEKLQLSGHDNPDKSAYYQAKHIATIVVKNEFLPVFSEDVLWYHSDTVKPSWAKQKKKVDKIGRHIFYKAGDKNV